MNNFHNKETTYINQIKLRVQDLEKQTEFYNEFLGLQIINQTQQETVLSADGKNALLVLETNKNAHIKQTPFGLYHFALLFDNETSLADLFLNLIEKKYAFDGFSDHGVSKAIYLRDPENNGIELYVDTPHQEWKFENGQVVMYTDQLNYQNLLLAASEQKFEKISDKTIMGHVHFYVENLEKSKEFFMGVLGFDLMLVFGDARFVSDKGYHHHVGFNTWLRNAKYAEENQTGLVEYYLNTTPETKQEILKRAKEKNVTHFIENGKDILIDINNIRVVM